MISDLVFYDLETTGANASTCKIVEMCFASREGVILHEYVNPGRPIEKSATEVHGIATRDVAEAPPFEEFAPQVQAIVDGSAVLVGFNNYKFDSVVLDRELMAAGMPGLEKDMHGIVTQPEADLFTMWKRHERRTLVTAARRFADFDLENAHSASADTTILPAILSGMRKEFGLEGLDVVASSQLEGAVDREGKFRRDENDRVVFAFGKNAGQHVLKHRDYLQWMLGKDFSPEVKAWCRRFLSA